MKKYRIEVIRTVYYEVEVDENIYTDEARKNWENTFWELDGEESTEAFARGLAEQSIRLGVNEFIEGFGRVMESAEQAALRKQRHDDVNDKMFICQMDDYVESESEEVKDFS